MCGPMLSGPAACVPSAPALSTFLVLCTSINSGYMRLSYVTAVAHHFLWLFPNKIPAALLSVRMRVCGQILSSPASQLCLRCDPICCTWRTLVWRFMQITAVCVRTHISGHMYVKLPSGPLTVCLHHPICLDSKAAAQLNSGSYAFYAPAKETSCPRPSVLLSLELQCKLFSRYSFHMEFGTVIRFWYDYLVWHTLPHKR